ncbi:MAG: hypothetical protein HYZ72_06610 [Deltaproteobacteria bacterium]|nr:hypothetical protein [Deltaproteobacteria bacterium]
MVHADLYQWTDTEGVIHVVGEEDDVPDAYRKKVKVYRAAKPAAPAESSTALLSPSRTYAEKSQGAFAQKLALDLGLIKHSGEDALGPLSGVGIQPAGGWRVSDLLTPEAYYEVLAAARRAADSQRLALSADGAEAVVLRAAESFLPPPPVAQAPVPPLERYGEEPVYDEEPEVIVEQPPPQVIEVIPEPYYVPVPFIVGRPHFLHHHNPPPGGSLPPPAPLTGPFTPNPAGGPTHMPFGASHMPFGASHMPFGSSRAR